MSYGPPPSQPPPQPQQPLGRAPENGIGTAALIMGILQFFCLGFVGSILAIVFGKIGMNKAQRGEATNGGSAKAGFILGIVGLCVGIIVLIIYVILAASNPTVYGY